MNVDAYKRSLIKIYFELLKKHPEKNFYTSPESVKHSLEEELVNYQKQLRIAETIFLEIERFLSKPIPIPPFLTKELVKILLDEICRDLKSIVSKIVSAVDTSQIYVSIANKRKWLYFLLFILTCIILSYVTSSIIKKNIYIFIIIFLTLSFIYTYIKLKYLSNFYELRISVLKAKCQQKVDEIEILETQIRASQLYNLEDLEAQIKIWLEEDKLNLIDLGMKRLKIEKLVDRNPILSLIGINSSEIADSHIIITDRGIDQIENKYKKILIDEDDFYQEKGLDGKYKYGVYECFVIFLGETFLSYYRCYWNFIKGAAVDEETCEYLYYCIVSVKTQERSSLRLENPEEKRKYRDLLSLTTMDGKIVYFKMSDDRKQKINSSNKRVSDYVSDLDQAAARIRYWLRQRRVDYQITKGID